ncbi:acetolactate decarboxylase [Cerasicoccus fimbriatus]|uniref:acetolactate decarboxylase n=1 Tax=Cerasicoccus fimbriatus TaxID=3014554 RepID=UPI0022B4EE3E|nr:acetolactate decarboxylase [Cerasicoccus sp. TK19100]
MRALLRILLCLALPASLLARGEITQFSVIDALLAGVYNGPTTIADLQEAGDFGIGTFNALDGELLMLDGVVYQVAHSGRVRVKHPREKTPFATVCRFEPEMSFPLWPVSSFSDFDHRWQTLSTVPGVMYFRQPDPLSENKFYAVRLTGTFAAIKARSVPKQTPPYVALADVVAEQNVFNFAEIEGTMVGFYCPPFARGVNVPGWHFHFISEDRQLGGHVLDFSIAKAGDVQVAWQLLDELVLKLPDDAGFAEVDLTPDRAEELETVERGRGQ